MVNDGQLLCSLRLVLPFFWFVYTFGDIMSVATESFLQTLYDRVILINKLRREGVA